jgi:hypothetical protein
MLRLLFFNRAPSSHHNDDPLACSCLSSSTCYKAGTKLLTHGHAFLEEKKSNYAVCGFSFHLQLTNCNNCWQEWAIVFQFTTPGNHRRAPVPFSHTIEHRRGRPAALWNVPRRGGVRVKNKKKSPKFDPGLEISDFNFF